MLKNYVHRIFYLICNFDFHLKILGQHKALHQVFLMDYLMKKFFLINQNLQVLSFSDVQYKYITCML
jgi:hypothetical protein